MKLSGTMIDWESTLSGARRVDPVGGSGDGFGQVAQGGCKAGTARCIGAWGPLHWDPVLGRTSRPALWFVSTASPNWSRMPVTELEGVGAAQELLKREADG